MIIRALEVLPLTLYGACNRMSVPVTDLTPESDSGNSDYGGKSSSQVPQGS
jgi:hypothetical protein